jgi:hypothetical protein
MIVTVDTETYKKNCKGEYVPVLDGTGKHFLLGCVYQQNGVTKTFYDPKELWNYLVELGEKCFKHKKKLTVYCHNARYDVYNILDKNDHTIRWFCEHPFIMSKMKTVTVVKTVEQIEGWKRYAKLNRINCSYRVLESGNVEVTYKKEMIKFLDSMSIFKMSLKRVGEIVKLKKLEMPDNKPLVMSKFELARIAEYCKRDCEIVMKGIEYVKSKLKKDGVNLRNLCTINQIAICYIMNEIVGNEDPMLVKNNENLCTEIVKRTKYPKGVHAGYRGGFVRAWKVGNFESVTYIDCNSLYPYALKCMKMPLIGSDRLVKEPLNMYQLKNLLNKVGVSRCMVKNVSNEIGFLMIRTNTKSFSPMPGKYMIGTWTHEELELAIKEGYEIVDIEWSVLYEETNNTLKSIYQKVYEKKQSAETEFERFFYKSIMNCSIGKFGQTRINQELFIDSVEKVKEYRERNIKVIKGVENSTDLIYSEVPKLAKKKYYCPIIPAMVTAKARCIMYENYKKVKKDDLIYTDTDSIIFQGDYLDKFEIGNEIGQFKIERDIETNELLKGVPAVIWGAKTKMVGNNMSASGVHKSALNKKDFVEGKAVAKKMLGIRSTSISNVGAFVETEKDMVKQKKAHIKSLELLNKDGLLIDYDIPHIKYFVKNLDVISNTFN